MSFAAVAAWIAAVLVFPSTSVPLETIARAFTWSAAPRAALRLAFAVELARIVARRVFAFERALQPVCDAPGPHPFDGRDARGRGGGDLRIAPAAFGAVGVGQQQDARVALAHRAGPAFAQEGFAFYALWGAESDAMLFLRHRTH